MWRWCLAILALISHVLLIAVCVFWVRSYWVHDSIDWHTPERYWSLLTNRGHYEFSWGYSAPSSPFEFDVNFGLSIVDDSTIASSLRDNYESGYAWAGFEYVYEDGERPDSVVVAPMWFITAVLAVLPLWCLVAFRRRYRALRRIAGGLCGACGYDLRGLQMSKCPECGAVSPLVRPSTDTQARC